MPIENELRLGNWVFGHNPDTMVKGEVGQFQVEVISEIGINFKKIFGADDWASKVEGIPLTPEILEKCGFRNDHGEGNMLWMTEEDKEEFPLIEAEFPKDEGFTFLFSMGRLDVDIVHLHQLQNLFFALTGTELNYIP